MTIPKFEDYPATIVYPVVRLRRGTTLEDYLAPRIESWFPDTDEGSVCRSYPLDGRDFIRRTLVTFNDTLTSDKFTDWVNAILFPYDCKLITSILYFASDAQRTRFILSHDYVYGECK